MAIAHPVTDAIRLLRATADGYDYVGGRRIMATDLRAAADALAAYFADPQPAELERLADEFLSGFAAGAPRETLGPGIRAVLRAIPGDPP